MDKPYKVLKIDSLIRPGETGGVEKYYRVTYKTKGGTVDAVDVAEKDYTEENVAAVLTAAAAKHDKILKL